MKVLIFDTTCAFLTPGGKTTHALKLQKEIEKLGVDIQFARWWDESQKDADVIHFLGLNENIVKQAKAHGIKMFYSFIFDHQSSKTEVEKKKSIIKVRLLEKFAPKGGVFSTLTSWRLFPDIDKIQFMHKYDMETALRYYPNYIDRRKVIIIPHAYDPCDMNISSNLHIGEMNFPKKYLVSCANISERKQTIKLAKLAKRAHVPIVFMGGRNVKDSYYQTFAKEVDNQYVFDPGYVSKEWKDCIESNASGYVLLSKGESGCIAVYEAAAYHLPLLLSNLPWAWGYDSPTDIYFCDQHNEELSLQQLKEFYEKAGRLNHTPFKIYTWADVAKMYVEQYKSLL